MLQKDQQHQKRQVPKIQWAFSSKTNAIQLVCRYDTHNITTQRGWDFWYNKQQRAPSCGGRSSCTKIICGISASGLELLSQMVGVTLSAVCSVDGFGALILHRSVQIRHGGDGVCVAFIFLLRPRRLLQLNYIWVLYLRRAAARLHPGSLQGQVGVAVLSFGLEGETKCNYITSSHNIIWAGQVYSKVIQYDPKHSHPSVPNVFHVAVSSYSLCHCCCPLSFKSVAVKVSVMCELTADAESDVDLQVRPQSL